MTALPRRGNEPSAKADGFINPWFYQAESSNRICFFENQLLVSRLTVLQALDSQTFCTPTERGFLPSQDAHLHHEKTVIRKTNS